MQQQVKYLKILSRIYTLFLLWRGIMVFTTKIQNHLLSFLYMKTVLQGIDFHIIYDHNLQVHIHIEFSYFTIYWGIMSDVI